MIQQQLRVQAVANHGVNAHDGIVRLHVRIALQTADTGRMRGDVVELAKQELKQLVRLGKRFDFAGNV